MTSEKAKIVVEAMISKDPLMANLLKEALSVLYNRGLGYIMVGDLQMVFISVLHGKPLVWPEERH